MSAVLKWHYDHNPIFKEVLSAAVKAKPTGTPLRLIVYCDEFVPGNPLHPEQRRKTCVWYVSAMEFRQCLACEHLWIPVGALLTSKMKKLSGGCSQAHKVLMESALSDQQGICNSGILLHIDGRPTLVTAELEPPLADELGIKSVFDVKGASGLKPCMKCTNVFMKGCSCSGLPGNVDLTCTDKSKFSPMEDADLYHASDLLAQSAPVVSKTKLAKMETSWGLNYSPDGVLQSALMRSRISAVKTRFDRMHVMESGGISDLEVDLLIESLSDSGKFSNQQLADYCNAGWIRSDGLPLRIFIRDDALKGMASDVLNAIPVLLHFVFSCLEDWDDAKVKSFKALFSVTAQFQRIKFSGDCSASETRKLADLIAEHCKLFQRAYGSDLVRPKHHLAFHLPDQYEEDECYMDCFPCERHHRVSKAEAENMMDTSQPRYEFCLLSKVNRVMVAECKDWVKLPAAEGEVIVNGEPYSQSCCTCLQVCVWLLLAEAFQRNYIQQALVNSVFF